MIELTLKTDRGLAAERGRDIHFVCLSFRAPKLERVAERPAMNLSLVLDRSGSMTGQKLELAKDAAGLALARLSRQDRFSLVQYDHEVNVLAPSRPATPQALDEARGALRSMTARGNTALFDGYLRGAEQVAAHLAAGEVGKVLLLTDGLANTGLTDQGQIVRHVAELRARGVHTSTFGVGVDFNHLLLEGMADAGGGSFYFVEKPAQLEDLLTSEVGESLETVAREVTIFVQHPADVRVRLLDAFVSESGDGRVTSRLGSLTSEQSVELLYEVELPGRPAGQVTSVRFSVSDADRALAGLAGAVEFRHASAAEVEAEQARTDVVRLAARRIRYEAGERIFAMNYAGEQDRVRTEASGALAYLEKLAAKDPEIAKLVEELKQDVEQGEMMLGAALAKMAYYDVSRLRRGRDASGKAIKHPR